MIADRNGKEIKSGQVAWYTDDSGMYPVTVLEVVSLKEGVVIKAKHDDGWIEILPPGKLEVYMEADADTDALFHFLCFVPFVLISGIVSWKLFEVLWKSWNDTDPSGIAGAGFLLIGFMFLCVFAFFTFCLVAMFNQKWFYKSPN